MGEASQRAPEFDTSVPNIARMYDYWLGGKDNFAADREAADRLARAIPQLPWLARQNRGFLQRAVEFCAREGVTQFLDIGSGLPTNQNVHEIAQHVNADSRVVYADNDPVVVAHARALLSGTQTAAVRGDICRPDDILGAPEVGRLIDFSRPVARASPGRLAPHPRRGRSGRSRGQAARGHGPRQLPAHFPCRRIAGPCGRDGAPERNRPRAGGRQPGPGDRARPRPRRDQRVLRRLDAGRARPDRYLGLAAGGRHGREHERFHDGSWAGWPGKTDPGWHATANR